MRIKVRLTLLGNQQYFGKLPDEIVEIPFEDYIKGVVAAEVGNTYLEACKAQAVAARSFAYPSARDGKIISDTGASDQAFIASRMYNAEKYGRVIQAVEETAGEVLTYKGVCIGKSAHYSSANNGTTKTKSYKWGSGDKPYLLGMEDPWTQGEIMRRELAGEKVRFGHGVGMSQYGAMFAASQGVNYKEILAFYYFGTDIEDYMKQEENQASPPAANTPDKSPSRILAESMADYARSKIGGKYVFGASGPENFDCSGLTKRICEILGLNLYHGATTQWLRGFQDGDPAKFGYWVANGTIDTLPPNATALLYNQDTKETRRLVMSHTGFYDGLTGKVIQSGGYGGKGVWEGTLDIRRWSHWAIPKGLEFERSELIEMTTILRRGSVGQAVREMQQALIEKGFDLGTFGADGKFGQKTETAVMAYQRLNGLTVNGTWGEPEKAKLSPTPEPPAPVPTDETAETVAVILSKDTAARLLEALKGVV